MLQRDFILGEEKYIKFRATSCDDIPIIITDANYTLTQNNVMESSGKCAIVNNDEILTLICPKNIGEYILEVTYTIAPETRKVRVAINVT